MKMQNIRGRLLYGLLIVAQEKTVFYMSGCRLAGCMRRADGVGIVGRMVDLKHFGRFRPCVFSAPFLVELAFLTRGTEHVRTLGR